MNTREHSVSVVMSVYRDPKQVSDTINSVLNQNGVELEFIIVSDGAEDDVLDVLKIHQSDSRVVILEQENQGLTKALINGCNKANHELIARIDAGDTMLEGRLAQQAEILAADSAFGMVTSWVKVHTEEGYELYTINLTQAELEQGLRSELSSNFVGPFHASMMFRKSLYHEVGAYREEFYFTQDCDLWARMIERSGIAVIEKVLTNGLFSPKGISGHYQPQQGLLRELVTQSISLRKQGESDRLVLQAAAKIHPLSPIRKSSEFDTIYFLAKMLSVKGSIHAKEYWQRALRLKPWSLRARLFSMQNFLQGIIKNNKT